MSGHNIFAPLLTFDLPRTVSVLTGTMKVYDLSVPYTLTNPTTPLWTASPHCSRCSQTHTFSMYDATFGDGVARGCNTGLIITRSDQASATLETGKPFMLILGTADQNYAEELCEQLERIEWPERKCFADGGPVMQRVEECYEGVEQIRRVG